MAGKPRAARPTDPEMEAINGAYADGQRSKEAEVEDLKARLSAAPWIYEMAGKVKTLAYTEAQARFFKLVMLKEVKEKKTYREQYGMTWEQFCEHVGVDRRKLDEQLQDLKPFKAEFSAVFAGFSGLEFHKIKYLGRAVSAESAEIRGNSIIYDGEEIPVTPEHAEDIQALLERLEESYQQRLEESAAVVRTKEKLIKAKEEVIHRQEKDLRRLEKEAQAKGLTAEEDAFIQRMENLRLEFTGYMLQVEPLRMEELEKENSPTVRMRAAYIALVKEMKMQLLAAYDTATEMYADAIMLPEEAWQPGRPDGIKG